MMPFVDRPGARVHYEVREPEGAARGAVTLVNGHTRTMQDFRMMARSLAVRGFRVLTVDNRGAGGTEASRTFSLEDMAGDLCAIWDALGWGKSDLAGISMGGMVSLTLALSAEGAERVRRLVLISTSPARRLVGSDEMPRTPEEIEAMLRRHFSPSFAEKQSFLIGAFVKEMGRAFEDPKRIAGAESQKAAMRGFDVTARLGELRCPTLIVHGDRDRVMPASAAETMAREIPEARLVLIPEVGHLLLAECPRILYDTVGEFLEKE